MADEKDKNKVKMQTSIPSSKVQRVAKFAKTGVKVGRNYLKHYAKKVVNPNLSTESLHEDNARDIYDSLSELKGSALKIAQMMSMDKNIDITEFHGLKRMHAIEEIGIGIDIDALVNAITLKGG